MDLFELPDQMAYGLIETVDESGTPDGVVRLECQFNPTDLTVRKSVVWSGGSAGENHTPGRNAPDLDFGGGKPATFSLNLLFDTTREPLMVDRDVRQYTDQLLRLTLMRSSGGKVLPPPLVSFQWGRLLLFKAVVTDVSITYIMFHSNGLPARARAEVQFTQQDPADDETAYQNPTTRTEARKTRVVQAGDRLDLIAYQEYGNSALWRELAAANHLSNPHDLVQGTVLVIPLLH
ncbi:MAG: LysM peptidoglycan-binding domain-containing protein [Anaerolineales bacterium]|nr:LysM peptidoglycan-binding domain-containing protein [Anaerolineales bacterium]